MDNCCEKENPFACSPCKKCGKGCCNPAQYDCNFSLEPDAMDPRFAWVSINGANKRIRIPDCPCSDPVLDLDCATKTMSLGSGENKQVFTGSQLGCILNLDDISDVNAKDPESCSILVFNPGCGNCPCTPEEATWQPYKIPDAGDCVISPDSEGYYHVLVKNDCGCPVECRLPVVPNGMISLNYMRDSVPDDPDFPWYYGIYNDTINLHLQDNAPTYFDKYALKVTVNYGIQCCKSTVTPNYNFRSLIVPVIAGESTINVEKQSSVLEGFCLYNESAPAIPWGTMELRGSFTFIVPKGREAYLHHEYRIRTNDSFPGWKTSAYDGQKIPDDVASAVDQMAWAGSRLHSLQVIVEPTYGVADFDPVVDAERTQLDPPVDEYPIN